MQATAHVNAWRNQRATNRIMLLLPAAGASNATSFWLHPSFVHLSWRPKYNRDFANAAVDYLAVVINYCQLNSMRARAENFRIDQSQHIVVDVTIRDQDTNSNLQTSPA